jgi:hypothetical protein
MTPDTTVTTSTEFVPITSANADGYVLRGGEWIPAQIGKPMADSRNRVRVTVLTKSNELRNVSVGPLDLADLTVWSDGADHVPAPMDPDSVFVGSDSHSGNLVAIGVDVVGATTDQATLRLSIAERYAAMNTDERVASMNATYRDSDRQHNAAAAIVSTFGSDVAAIPFADTCNGAQGNVMDRDGGAVFCRGTATMADGTSAAIGCGQKLPRTKFPTLSGDPTHRYHVCRICRDTRHAAGGTVQDRLRPSGDSLTD